ncbi:hypothetical protein S40293_02311 [Stachybotrys chartarum IBT 40293]|nr:hypothetical protein S40293_02311 [Stachybotrys chartarum IBT 40293]KFA79083.1 hypothetical protein S40288_07042 [Stachybotrys chartarum IBT 40288]
MPMLKEPWKKYKKFTPLDLPNRQWPSRTLDHPCRFLDTSLRDGNQSIPTPMDGEEKWRYFRMLCEIGFKEIEVSFPSASQTDFDFTRRLIETPGAVPDDVAIQVLSPCRPNLIERTVESVKGAKNAIIHIYLATSECFRQVVFNYTEDESIALAVQCTKLVRSLTKDAENDTNWQFEFSPETFSDTTPEFAVRICEAVKEAWGPTVDNKIIFNLPATVEMAPPNVYADQVEYFCTNISEREKVCVSLHPHNDRGCAVAAAELGQMAGADRVEGVILGNGERTGNIDLVTLALNLYTQGISPGLDFSDLNHVIETVEACTRLPTHPRTPYVGSLVYSAFSGSHQDAIKKGFQTRKSKEDPWKIPYLPLDPEDIGRTYEAVIRVNSQSGKGGSAWVIFRKLHLDLPRGLQVSFSNTVQTQANQLGRELQADEITNLFETTYLPKNPRFVLIDYSITPDRSHSPMPTPGKTPSTQNLMRVFEGVVSMDGKEIKLRGRGNGPLSSLATALKELNVEVDVNDYKEHAIGEGRDVKAASYVECRVDKKLVWGVGIHEDVVQSSLIAMLNAISNAPTSGSNGTIVKPIALRSSNNGETNGTAPKDTGAPSIVSVLEERASNM